MTIAPTSFTALSIAYITAADDPGPHIINHQPAQMQLHAMHKLLSIDPAVYANDPNRWVPYPCNRNVNDPCNYHGMECRDGIIRKIRWENHLSRAPDIDADWLPGTLRLVSILYQKVLSPLETRYLPKKLTHLRLFQCYIEGSVDLQHLPATLHFLDLRRNKLKGAVALVDLPERIVEILLNGNQLSHACVAAEDLPDSLVIANVSAELPKKITYVFLDDGPLNSRVITRDAQKSGVIDSFEAGNVAKWEAENAEFVV